MDELATIIGRRGGRVHSIGFGFRSRARLALAGFNPGPHLDVLAIDVDALDRATGAAVDVADPTVSGQLFIACDGPRKWPS